jgi:xanthine dehydrogenase YagS FAD-binding subunit
VRPFSYARARRPEEAVGLVAGRPRARFIAGGTDLLNLMKDGVQEHDQLIDINALSMSGIELVENGAVRIGALARMRDVAEHDLVRNRLPVVSEALLASASPQVRNMASIGGNLLQRTRCSYFRDAAMPCNKRVPGSGCPAIAGQNRWHAILGGSGSCIAVHPSDLAVALVALDAVVLILGPDGDRRAPLREFYLVPGNTPDQENALRHGELITAVEVPATALSAHSRYVKLRDRASFEFAVVSVAAALRMRGRTVCEARLAFGGVATGPWRSAEAEQAIIGRALTPATIDAAGQAAIRDAVPREHNGFKVELVQRALAGLLGDLGGRR